MNKDMDRDIVEQLIDLISNIRTLIHTISDNKYGPRILTQPVDKVVAIGERFDFTVVAENVAEYQWQVKVPDGDWANSTALGNKTDHLYNIQASEARYTYLYRCKLTGLNGTVIYTNEVKPVAPEPEET